MQQKFILGTACVVLFGASAMAHPQQSGKPQGDKPVPRAEHPLAQATPAAMPAACRKGSEVLGAKVRDAKFADIGKVEDLVVDPTTGAVDYAVLSLEGKDKWYAVPFGKLTVPTPMSNGVGPEGDAAAKREVGTEFTLNVDKAKLESAPSFAKDKWPDMSATAWRADIEKHFSGSDMRGTSNSGDVVVAHQSARLSKLLDENIYTDTNEKLGEVEELAVDSRNARIAFAVVSTGGFLGIGDSLHAIPWEAVKAAPEGSSAKERLQVSITKDRLKAAPEFKKDQWARMSETAWISDLYKYYGLRPYSSTAVDASTPRMPAKPMPGGEQKPGKKPMKPNENDPH